MLLADCDAAAVELREEIKKAKVDLVKKGMKLWEILNLLIVKFMC